MGFWIAALALGYILGGITKINGDIRSGTMHAPGYVRDGRTGVALVASMMWPLYRGIVSTILTLVFCALVSAGLMWLVGLLLPLVWQIVIVGAIFVFLLMSNVAMIAK